MGTGSSDHADRTRFETIIAAAPAELPPARHRFSRWLTDAGVDDDDVSDLEVVFSELVTNAISASTGPSASVTARASWEGGDTIALEIVNSDGHAPLDVSRWDIGDQLRRGGRGLVIVRAFSDAVTIDRAEDGAVVVRCRRSVRVTGH